MSKENGVVLRNPKNNRRKNTDGYRTDSGCFEDVDLQMANRHSPTSNSSEPAAVDNSTVASTEECEVMTDHSDTSPICSSLADECADDKDFHAILKRLSDITSDPGDLYRLCFSSRLSYCGHMASNAEDGEATGRSDENDNSTVVETSTCTSCEILNESLSEKGEKCAKRSSHGQQCVELLSLLSSCAMKAKENPSMFSNSSLGNSLVGQLSSLLSTLEEVKRNSTQSNEGKLTSTGEDVSPNTQLTVPECTSLITPQVDENESSLLSQNTNTSSEETDLSITRPINNYDQQASRLISTRTEASALEREQPDLIPSEKLEGKQPLHLKTSEELQSEGPLDTKSSGFTLNSPTENHNKPLSSSGEIGKVETKKSTPSLKISFASNNLHSELSEACPATKDQSDNGGKTASLLKHNEVPRYRTSLPVSNIPPSFVTTSQERPNKADSTLKHPPDSQDENQFVPDQPEGANAIPEHHITDTHRSTSSETDGDDVVTTGRRAVKPYSWDYGDIWEKELERARSTESFQSGEQEGYFPSRKDPVRDMLPSFEEIRDELFQNAGFTYDNSDPSKRRSRSADARPNLQDSNTWPGRSDVQSPFVRTVYQNGASSSTGLRRSWSSNHVGGNSFMVNVDWTNGRQMTVMSGPVDGGFDDVQAQVIKEAVLKTSTFRGQKPWSVLKRRPSGLRRRSARNESLRSSKNNELNGRTDQDSESSDSPNVSATSSDCLTTATDDNSSVTSSKYYAASSLPSSPSVSNRNSACFSDTSTSDTSDIRRVAFQSSPSDSGPRNLYSRGYEIPATRGMTLDRRFGYIDKHYRTSPNEGRQNPSIKELRDALASADKFGNENSKNHLRGQSSTLPRKWPDDQMISPLLACSDSDLNHLTKVQFVGDSFSRSRISKNLRHTRKRPQSPSPVGPRSAHTRVLSCEIVQSDNGKRDVYTKVNIAESFNDEETPKTHGSRSTKLGNPSIRQSWHGQSQTCVPSRHSPTNRTMAPMNGSTRHSFSSRSGPQQRQSVHSQRGTRDEKQVHSTLLPGNDHHRLRNHWSTGSLRLSGSERPRVLPDNVVMNRPHGHSSMKQTVHANFERNLNGIRNRNDGRAQSWDADMRSERLRSPPDYLTAVKRSQGIQRRMNQRSFPGQERHIVNPNKTFPNNRALSPENTRLQTRPKEPMSHIVKETSFVGPSTFTKYQSSSSSLSPRTRRSRSLNEKSTMSQRRLEDSDVYRRRAMEMNQNSRGEEYLNQASRCDSDVMTLPRPDRRRRYSEGATRRSTRHDVTFSEGFVDASYCDPHRMSIQEGTYSIANAESARDGRKSDDTRVPCPSSSEARTETKSCELRKQGKISEIKDNFTSNKAACDTGIVSTSMSSQHKLHAATKNDQTSQQNNSAELKITPTEYAKAVRISRPNSTEVNNLSALPHQEMNKTYADVSLRATETPHINAGESRENMSLILTNKKMKQTPSVAHSSPGAQESGSVIVAQQLLVDNIHENERIISLPHETNEKNESIFPKQKILQHTNNNNEESGEVISATEVEDVNAGIISNISPSLKSPENLPYVKGNKASPTHLRREAFPCKQFDQIDGQVYTDSRHELMSDKSVIPANNLHCSEQRKSNPINPGGVIMNQNPEDAAVIISPVLSKRKSQDNEVNVFIDYREKRPVSVEFSEEDVSFLKTLGRTARASRRNKLNKNSESKIKIGRNNLSCTTSDVARKQDLKNDEDVVHSRLSRKDKYERETLASKVNNLESLQPQVVPASSHQPSPTPYRRDSTIIFTDARTSFGSDTDSISRDSTVSSSGSDMTVILHDDMDISVEDLKQLTESGSKIGIEIAPIHVETADELLAGRGSNPDELPPAMELSNTFANYQQGVPEQNKNVNPKTKERSKKLKENSSSTENSGKNNTLKRLVESLRNENLSSDNLLPSSYNMQSSCSSIASSRASSKSTGTEGSKGRSPSKNGGKGFLSRLKSFRNSFRAKKSDSVSFESNGYNSRNGVIDENDHNRNENLSRRFPSTTDANANVVSSSRSRTKSESKDAQTHGAQVMSRRSYDVFRHPNNDLRRVVGVKSVSSDHLNAYRVNNASHANEVTGKSIEVLVETCI